MLTGFLDEKLHKFRFFFLSSSNHKSYKFFITFFIRLKRVLWRYKLLSFNWKHWPFFRCDIFRWVFHVSNKNSNDQFFSYYNLSTMENGLVLSNFMISFVFTCRDSHNILLVRGNANLTLFLRNLKFGNTESIDLNFDWARLQEIYFA